MSFENSRADMDQVVGAPRQPIVSDCPVFENRRADFPIDPIFLRRWSPRAMSGEALTPRELLTVLEAARWAPSARNAQPWRFLYALPDSPSWQTFQAFLNESHRQWVGRAGALVLILAKRITEGGGQISHTYSFDAGGACQNACLQAAMLDLVSHVVQSFDSKGLRWRLGISDEYSIEFMLVLGRPGDPSALPPALQAREAPTPRRGLGEIACEGSLSMPSGIAPQG